MVHHCSFKTALVRARIDFLHESATPLKSRLTPCIYECAHFSFDSGRFRAYKYEYTHIYEETIRQSTSRQTGQEQGENEGKNPGGGIGIISKTRIGRNDHQTDLPKSWYCRGNPLQLFQNQRGPGVVLLPKRDE